MCHWNVHFDPQTFVIRLPENVSKTADCIRYCPFSRYGNLPNKTGRVLFSSYLPHYTMKLWRPNSWNELLTKPGKDDEIYKLGNSEKRNIYGTFADRVQFVNTIQWIHSLKILPHLSNKFEVSQVARRTTDLKYRQSTFTIDHPQCSMLTCFFSPSSYLTEACLNYEKCFFGIPGRERCVWIIRAHNDEVQ